MKLKFKYLIIGVFLSYFSLNAQKQATEVDWITFEQLYDSIKSKPRKVFIDFYADWCVPCKRMDKEVFTDSQVIEILNDHYYTVKMNVESADTIRFGEQTFVNERLNRRNPVHQIALLMARRKNKPFSLPAMVILDENFKARERYFQFLNATQLLKILKED